METPKILFMGTPHFAATALSSLVREGFNIVGVVTQPDKKVGRGGKLEAPETKIVAQKANIAVFQPETTEELIQITKELAPELIVVAAYGRKIPGEILELPEYKTLNIHGSLLPDYRGASCVAQAILDGKTETGITIMEMDENIDTGAIIYQTPVKIESYDTTSTLTEKLALLGAKTIAEVIPKWIEGQLMPQAQEHEKATHCRLIRKEDGKVDWTKPAPVIERMVRAYIPWPNAYTFLDGKMIKILETKVVDRAIEPGKILFENKEMFIGTGVGSLGIIKLKPENSKEMAAIDFINGNKNSNGKFFSS